MPLPVAPAADLWDSRLEFWFLMPEVFPDVTGATIAEATMVEPSGDSCGNHCHLPCRWFAEFTLALPGFGADRYNRRNPRISVPGLQAAAQITGCPPSRQT